MGRLTTHRLVVAFLLAAFSASLTAAWAQSAAHGTFCAGSVFGRRFAIVQWGIPPRGHSSFRGTGIARGVDWGGLFRESFLFLAIENSFRCATEQGTRDAISNPFFPGYLNSVGNLHGWNDGDPFYVNYVGHPMQGAVSGDIWTHNDRAYRNIQFGKNRRYWKGKLRAGAYSYIYSILFEIGPISEASIGNIQAYYPQQGFVDHIVTPVMGLGWSISEDVLDQYLIRRIESQTTNRWILLLARGGLNPARTMANAMALQPPWHRDNRPGDPFS